MESRSQYIDNEAEEAYESEEDTDSEGEEEIAPREDVEAEINSKVIKPKQKLCNRPGCTISTDTDMPFCRRHIGYIEREIEKRTAARVRYKELSLEREKEVKRKHDETLDLFAKKEKRIARNRVQVNNPKLVEYLRDESYLRDNNIHDPMLEKLIADMKDKDTAAREVSEKEYERMAAYVKKVKAFAKDNSLNEQDAAEVIVKAHYKRKGEEKTKPAPTKRATTAPTKRAAPAHKVSKVVKKTKPAPTKQTAPAQPKLITMTEDELELRMGRFLSDYLQKNSPSGKRSPSPPPGTDISQQETNPSDNDSLPTGPSITQQAPIDPPDNVEQPKTFGDPLAEIFSQPPYIHEQEEPPTQKVSKKPLSNNNSSDDESGEESEEDTIHIDSDDDEITNDIFNFNIEETSPALNRLQQKHD